MVAVFVLAAIVGGVAAGLVSARVMAEPLPARRSIFWRSTIVGCLLVLPLAAVDYHFYWPETADRLPVRRVSHQAILNLNADDSRDSSWTACYQYLGQFSRGSGVVGSEGGFLTMTQLSGTAQRIPCGR
jgi:hypothetical protein